MPIDTREQALQALGEILAVPDRQQQLIRITVALSQCTTEEARQVLTRAAEGFVEGRLETKRRSRLEVLKETIDHELELRRTNTSRHRMVIDYVTVREQAEQKRQENEEREQRLREARILDSLGSSLDALKTASLLLEIYPDLTEFFEPWEVARLVMREEEIARDFVQRGTQEPDRRDELKGKLATLLLSIRPWWRSNIDRLREACMHVAEERSGVIGLGHERATASILFDVIAATEMKGLYAAGGSVTDGEAMRSSVRAVRDALEKLLQVMYPAGLPEGKIPAR